MLRTLGSWKAPLAVVRNWAIRLQHWCCAEATRRALAAVDDSHLDQLSEVGRQMRRDALRRLRTDRLSSHPLG
jgi:hypothetical protein